MSEIPDFVIPIEVPQPPAIAQVGYTTRELSILRATPTEPGIFALVLRAADENGEWRSDVPPVVVRKEDDLTSNNPMAHNAASIFHQLMFTAICADNPTNQALGVVGLSVWDAGKVILAQEFAE